MSKFPTTEFEHIMRLVGLQTDSITTRFFNSREGKEVVAHIVEAYEKKEQEKEIMLELFAEYETNAAAILSAIEEEEEERQEVMLHEQPVKLSQQSKREEVKDKEKPTITSYEEDLASLETELEDAENELLQAKAKYENYDNNLREVDSFITTLDSSDIAGTQKALEKEIERASAELKAEAETVSTLVDEGDYAGARTKLEQLNAKNLQIGTLKDMLAVTKGEKQMYNQNGELVSSFKEAAFIVPSDKQLIKEGEQFYLLDKGKTLSSTNREAAREDFVNAKSEMASVRNLVDNNRSTELGEIDQKIAGIAKKIEKLQEEKSHGAKNDNTLSAMPDTLAHHSQHSHAELYLNSSDSSQKTTQTTNEDNASAYKH
ncbi:hypothetical protein [Legionella jamestowniensis]|nr:hypothetical protein [Legionella jamestowniensis]OCH97716.1 hypothetical protein A8135_02430 [Legionella jamestowniensis]